MTTYWLSYGGGVNSTALAVLLCEGKLPQYTPWRAIFSDTGNEKDETYAYIRDVMEPYFARHGQKLIHVRPDLSVLEYWQSYSMVGSRVIRSCTDKAKIKPIAAYLDAHADPDDASVIGIDAGEEHRAKQHPKGRWPKIFPLVEAGIDRAGCEAIIRGAGLPVPPKSGCWHCPFMRVSEIRALFHAQPQRFAAIARLESRSLEAHPLPPPELVDVFETCSECAGEGELTESLFDGPCTFCDGAGEVKVGQAIKPSPKRAQWSDTYAHEWASRFAEEAKQGRITDLPQDRAYDEIPCGCFDGAGDDEVAP